MSNRELPENMFEWLRYIHHPDQKPKHQSRYLKPLFYQVDKVSDMLDSAKIFLPEDVHPLIDRNILIMDYDGNSVQGFFPREMVDESLIQYLENNAVSYSISDYDGALYDTYTNKDTSEYFEMLFMNVPIENDLIYNYYWVDVNGISIQELNTFLDRSYGCSIL